LKAGKKVNSWRKLRRSRTLREKSGKARKKKGGERTGDHPLFKSLKFLVRAAAWLRQGGNAKPEKENVGGAALRNRAGQWQKKTRMEGGKKIRPEQEHNKKKFNFKKNKKRERKDQQTKNLGSAKGARSTHRLRNIAGNRTSAPRAGSSDPARLTGQKMSGTTPCEGN